MKKILLSLLCAISILFIGCGKKFEGKYTHFDLRKEKAAIYFMNDKIRYTIDGKEVGIFDKSNHLSVFPQIVFSSYNSVILLLSFLFYFHLS